MSGLIVGTVLKYSRARGNSRLVLIVIGDCAKDDGTGAWPSIKTIADRAGISERTAQRSIRELAELGELIIDENAGPKGAHLYSVVVPNRRGDNLTGVTNQAGGGDKSGDEGVTRVTPDPSFLSITVKEPPVRSSVLEFPTREPLDEWPSGDLWIKTFIQSQQHAFNGTHVPQLISHHYWELLAEAVNGLSPEFLRIEFSKMELWLRDNPRKLPTPRGVRRFVSSWLQRAADKERLAVPTAPRRFS